MNLTEANITRCLLIQSGLPVSFWAEATSVAVKIRNMSPSRSIQNKIPLVLWKGTTISMSEYERLKPFGCRGWMCVEGEYQFAPRGVECIFIVYETNTKGYRVWLEKERSVRIVHQVVFDENVFSKLQNVASRNVNTAAGSGVGEEEVGQFSYTAVTKEVGEGGEPADPPEFIDPFAECLHPTIVMSSPILRVLCRAVRRKFLFMIFPVLMIRLKMCQNPKIHFMTFRKLKSNLDPNLFLVDRRELKDRCCVLVVI